LENITASLAEKLEVVFGVEETHLYELFELGFKFVCLLGHGFGFGFGLGDWFGFRF